MGRLDKVLINASGGQNSTDRLWQLKVGVHLKDPQLFKPLILGEIESHKYVSIFKESFLLGWFNEYYWKPREDSNTSRFKEQGLEGTRGWTSQDIGYTFRPRHG